MYELCSSNPYSVHPSCEFIIREKGMGFRSPSSFCSRAFIKAWVGARAIALDKITPNRGQTRLAIISDISLCPHFRETFFVQASETSISRVKRQ